jgi:cytidylate kinase
VNISGKRTQEALKDMKRQMPYSEFMAKYSEAESTENLLMSKDAYVDYSDVEMVQYSSLLTRNRIEKKGGTKEYNKPVKDRWIYSYWETTEYSEESLRGFFFIDEFAKAPLEESYARMVQYTDCMIDTNSLIFTVDDYGYPTRTSNSAIETFINYVNEQTEKPEIEDKKYKEYYAALDIWDSTRFITLDKLSVESEEFKKLLKEAVDYAVEEHESYTEFELYVARYYSKKTALELKRGRRVMGMCSQDQGPRIHAMSIAVLSAETVNWEVFLRAHLDIMNDRFERVSDGSYAWAARKTYIRELEELDINVEDLLLGITLRIENPNKNHYFGCVGRLGRALSESQNSEQIESKILNMIQDSNLDDYNRFVMCYLFLNYNYYLEDESKKEANQKRFAAALESLPPAYVAHFEE